MLFRPIVPLTVGIIGPHMQPLRFDLCGQLVAGAGQHFACCADVFVSL